VFAQALGHMLKVRDAPEAAGKLPEEARRWLEPLAKDLSAHLVYGLTTAAVFRLAVRPEPRR